MLCKAQHINQFLSTDCIFCRQIPVFRILHHPFKMPKVHCYLAMNNDKWMWWATSLSRKNCMTLPPHPSTLIPFIHSIWFHHIDKHLKMVELMNSNYGSHCYYQPCTMVCYQYNFMPLFLQQFNSFSCRIFFLKPQTNSSCRTTILSLNLPGWPCIVPRICQQWFTVMLYDHIGSFDLDPLWMHWSQWEHFFCEWLK